MSKKDNQASLYLQALLSPIGIITESDKGLISEFEKAKDKAIKILSPKTNASLESSNRVPLRSILSQINGNPKTKPHYYHQPSPLNVSEVDLASVFPAKTNDSFENIDVSAKHVQTINELEQKIEEAKIITDQSAFNYTIYHLLHNYTSRISAFSKGMADDVSLFDYTRVLAALVNCVYQSPDSNPEQMDLLLIKAGIPSIQKFIYSGIDISQVGGSDKLSKKLRGRSFYINLLNNFLAERFLEELGLTEANLIFASGGHFLMIAPTGDNMINKINELKKEVNLILMKDIGTRLGLEIAYKEVEAKELFQNLGDDKNPGFHIADVSTQLDEVQKYKKHEAYLEQIFYPPKIVKTSNEENAANHLNDITSCSEIVNQYAEDDLASSQEKVNPDFQDDLWLGINIPYSDYIVQIKLEDGAEKRNIFEKMSYVKSNSSESNSKKEYGRRDDKYIAKWLAWRTIIFMPRSRKKDPNKLKTPSEIVEEVSKLLQKYQNDILSVKFILLNKTNIADYFDLTTYFDFPIAFGFRFLGSESRQFFKKKDEELLQKKYKEDKLKVGDVLPFEELQKLKYDYEENKNSQEVIPTRAKKEDPSKLGYPMLAVMRLDVDYLGGIFAHGLGQEVSFTRIATLSRELDMFFSGYFNTLVNKYQLYTTYSGGDDAFVVGSWYNLAHFAKTFHEKFKKFACHNKDVNFSAGIFFCDSHYPVAKFAEDAADLEGRSKRFEIKEKKIIKNAVTVFDRTLSWDNYKAQIVFAENVWKCIEGTNINTTETPKLTRAVIHKLLRMIQSSLDKKGINHQKFHRNRAQLHGLLSRQGLGQKKIDELTDELMQQVIKKIIQDFKNHKEALDDTVAFNYVLWKTRKLE